MVREGEVTREQGLSVTAGRRQGLLGGESATDQVTFATFAGT